MLNFKYIQNVGLILGYCESRSKLKFLKSWNFNLNSLSIGTRYDHFIKSGSSLDRIQVFFHIRLWLDPDIGKLWKDAVEHYFRTIARVSANLTAVRCL